MVDIKILEKHGISAEAWKAKLIKLHENNNHLHTASLEEPDNDEDRLKAFHCRLRSRVQAGIQYNLTNYHTIYLLDLIWDTPKRTVSPTLLATMTQAGKTDEDVMNALKVWGYDISKLQQDLLEKDEKTGKTKPSLNVPAFIDIVVPLVRAYMTARKARIVNDHNLRPWIQYKPEINTPEERLKCELQSDASDQQARWFNYINKFDQAVHKMLLYPTGGILMPREEWYTEKQTKYKKDGKGEEDVIVKEGIRYHCPHPSRYYYDQAYPIRDLNTDTGPRWVGYWKVVRFSEIKENEAFYNTDRVYPGSAEWWQGYSTFFSTVYSTCTLNFPTCDTIPHGMEKVDRETWLANNFFYNNEFLDRSAVLTEHYEKIIPKDVGLGDYEHGIWARFVLAGDGTIVYASPVGYNPALVFKDNGDDGRLEECSQAQMMIPYQDQVQNLLIQYLISVRQNLTNLTLIDQNVLDKGIIDKIRNFGEKFFRSINIIPADFKQKASFGQHSIPAAVQSFRFPFQDTNGILQAIRTVLDLAERVLGFSAQEVGQAASHEQTQDEIHLIANSMDNTLQYTQIPVDAAMAAWGEQLYEARMNYGSDDFYAGLPLDPMITDERLEEMGITVLEKGLMTGDKSRAKIKKTAMELESFATVPPTYRRVTNNAMVRDLTVFFRDIMNNPLVAQSIGPDQALAIVNSLAELADLPLPGPLRNVAAQQMKQIEQLLAEQKEDVRMAFENIGKAIQRNTQNIAIIGQSMNLQLPNGNSQPAPQPDGQQPPVAVAPQA